MSEFPIPPEALELYATLEFIVPTSAKIGSLAVGVAQTEEGLFLLDVVEVVEVEGAKVGKYDDDLAAPYRQTSDDGSRFRAVPPNMYAEFLQACKNKEYDFGLE